jgi:hypothetical protein
MSMTKIALAVPLALGIACSTSGSQSKDHTGAMWSEQQHKDAATQAYLQGTGSSGSQDQSATPQGSGSPSSDTGSSGSMGSSGSSGSSDSMGSSGSSSGSTQGGAMGSGGSSETMGSGSASGSSDQGTTGSGSSDQAQQGATAGAGNTGAHEGDQHVMGKVSKVSDEEISIKPKSGQAKTLKINQDTTVSINGKDAKPSQLKQGQQVRASFENVSGDDVAVKIEVGKAMRHGRMKHGGTSGSSDTGSTGSH